MSFMGMTYAVNDELVEQLAKHIVLVQHAVPGVL